MSLILKTIVIYDIARGSHKKCTFQGILFLVLELFYKKLNILLKRELSLTKRRNTFGRRLCKLKLQFVRCDILNL